MSTTNVPPQAAFHRRVEITTRATGPGRLEARGAVEDDYHHFRAIVRAEEGVVVEALAEALRFPNTLCPAAGQRITEIVGMRLDAASAAVMAATDARQQCTHQIDLAGLAVAALARGIGRRRYDVTVPDRVDGRTTATLRRDGEPVLRWEVDGARIVAPEPFAGRDLGAGFTGFARSLPLDVGEAALVLRRTVYVSSGRGMVRPAGATGPLGGCWAWQPERAATVQRLPTKLDFTGRAEVLTAEDQGWLAFEG